MLHPHLNTSSAPAALLSWLSALACSFSTKASPGSRCNGCRCERCTEDGKRMSAIQRGLRNPFRNKVRTTVVLLLLSVVIGLFAVMVQAAFQTQEQLESLQARLRTLIELREAGAFGTGGFGGDKPVGAEEFSLTTLKMVKQIPNAKYITKIEEYVHIP